MDRREALGKTELLAALALTENPLVRKLINCSCVQDIFPTKITFPRLCSLETQSWLVYSCACGRCLFWGDTIWRSLLLGWHPSFQIRWDWEDKKIILYYLISSHFIWGETVYRVLYTMQESFSCLTSSLFKTEFLKRVQNCSRFKYCYFYNYNCSQCQLCNRLKTPFSFC